ncbi:MAG: VWA domain-containing protein [Deltaproteobacteria bacterium]|jgi:Ca-activated chloride channel homolog|nr:VWA domain-containing protein [Deltaproteobacteria bacterium]MBT6431605.1 VWA domain-containing protein [Deltaproteobacteria bacterium]MBT6492208.1 VWA domain-containing protein [Deltaproteobacteria bacterium]
MKTTSIHPFPRALRLALLMLTLVPALSQASTPRSVVHDELKVFTDPGKLPMFETKVRGETVKLPLQHTHVDVEITAGIARVEVTQTYKNLYKRPIEALYTFPLPMNSAVNRMQMVIGDRTIEAQIKERKEARAIYEKAKAQGHTASLLEQERPNIFSQSVANIAPETDIDIVVSYVQSLTYANHQWEFVFPMVVGPRFIPPGHQDGPGTQSYQRLRPLILGQGERPGHDISMNLAVFSGSEIQNFVVPTHDVTGKSHTDGSLRLTLSKHDRIPNRDFIFKYQTASALPEVSVLTHREENDGYFGLTLVPPLPLKTAPTPNSREFIFVVDVSGSMNGVPLNMCKDAMREALSQIRADDTFNVLTFAGQTKKAFATPRRASEHNIQEAIATIDRLRAGGGTMMANAIREALNPDTETERERYVFFMTDGYVGNEKQIFSRTQNFITTLEERGQKARVFGFGVGSSVNRHLLNGLSEAGQGITFYASTRQDPAQGVREFFRTLEQPFLSNISLEFEGLAIADMEPQVIPDLLAGRPLEILGRFEKPGQGKLHIHGILRGREHTISLPVILPGTSFRHGALKTRWARARLHSLSRQAWTSSSDKLKQEITELGLAHNLVTAYTSFVAVDSSAQMDGADSLTIEQPTHLAEGLNPHTAGNRRRSAPMPRMFHQKGTKVIQNNLMGSAATGSRGAPVPEAEVSKLALDGQVKLARPSKVLSPMTPRYPPLKYFVQTRGGLKRHVIIKSLKKSLKEAPRCVLSSLEKGPKAGQGLEITVNRHGRVVSVTIVAPGKSQKSDHCIRSFFEGIRFPPSSSGRSTQVLLRIKSPLKL